MDDGEGVRASLTVSLLIGVGANQGLPVSTTHVASGAIAGAGGTEFGRLGGRTLADSPSPGWSPCLWPGWWRRPRSGSCGSVPVI